ncbi:hypothetical protein [Aliiroseovarius sediminis]|uniref:hypothetical protein n=1 Tax=Aliiroseovarius sediminis TaxID=2925839 RepID=UPI001F5909EC|nr:hypothetical protein [Aliiroseovarius sediminis]MCI2394117.1 hypothetical protein [Aliiroseovarius sediminis]
MALRFWVIVGESETGKSTTIGHLVGQFGRSQSGLIKNGEDFAHVPLSAGGLLRVFSMRCALQENPDGKEGPEGAVEHCEKKWGKSEVSSQYHNCLIALRHFENNGQPNAFGYLNKFVEYGSSIERLVLFDLLP